ncbi:MAG: hypothetical protein ACRCX2_14995 [Paraclostridium sp.]
MDKRYKELLSKYAGDNDLKELLKLVILDDFRVREKYYSTNKSYPDKQDLLGKLKVDLDTTEAYLNSKR